MTKQEVLIEHAEEMWRAINNITIEPHISFVVINLQRMEALRVKIQEKINKEGLVEYER